MTIDIRPNKKPDLRPYQKEGAIFAAATIHRSGGAYIAHPPGAGKSLTAIATARLLKCQRVLIVCPLVAIGVWQREVATWWPVTRAHSAKGWLAVNGNATPTGLPTVLVINYDKLDPSTLTQLCDWTPDLLIVDEGQYVKSPTAHRTRAVWKLADRSAGVLYLSGTPAHSVLDWWAQYRVIARDDPAFKMNFTAYKQSLLQLGGPNGNWPVKDKRTGLLKIKPDAYRRITAAMAPYTHTAPHALDDLIEPVEQEIPFDLDATEREVYTQMATILRADLAPNGETTAEIVLTKILRLTQIAAGHVTGADGKVWGIGHSREEALMDLLEQHSGEKVVIACRFTEDIKRIRDRLGVQGRPCYVIDGSVTGPQRTSLEDAFQTPDGRNTVFVLQYQAGGVAITLTAAHVLILYTLDPSVIRYQQVKGRIWRIGQKGRCLVYTLCANDTQDSVMLSGLQRGYAMVDLAKVLLQHLRSGL